MCRDALAVSGKGVLHVLDIVFAASGADPAARKPCDWSERRENRYRLKERFVGTLWEGGQRTMEAYEGVLLHISDDVLERMDGRRILREDVQKVIHHAETGKGTFVNPRSGRFLASFRPGHVTYWVEYIDEGDAWRVHNAYSHRMEIKDSSGLAMTAKYKPNDDSWLCGKCNQPLQLQKMQATYLGNVFSIDLPKCAECGTALVTEEMAVGKLAEAEQILEDK
jgi:hypothetical protein